MEKTKKLSVGPGQKNPDIAPANTKDSLKRIESLIEDGTKTAKVLLDGRGVKVPGYEKGNFIGPCIIDECKPGMRVYDEEIFGPVMIIVRADNLS